MYPLSYINRGLVKRGNRDLNGSCKDWQFASESGSNYATKLTSRYFNENDTNYEF